MRQNKFRLVSFRVDPQCDMQFVLFSISGISGEGTYEHSIIMRLLCVLIATKTLKYPSDMFILYSEFKKAMF